MLLEVGQLKKGEIYPFLAVGAQNSLGEGVRALDRNDFLNLLNMIPILISEIRFKQSGAIHLFLT